MSGNTNAANTNGTTNGNPVSTFTKVKCTNNPNHAEYMREEYMEDGTKVYSNCPQCCVEYMAEREALLSNS